MRTKLLRIIRANFEITYDGWFHQFICWNKNRTGIEVHSDWSFDAIVKMLEQIYPQGRHYTILRHSRSFKQARRDRIKKALEVASISLVVLAIITILVLNTCCGSGIQY